MKKDKSPHFISCWVFSLLAQGHNALMRSKTTRAAIVCASSAGIFIATANAQPDITWQIPVTISDPSDVSTLGFYFGSWAPHGSTLAVNGVTFQAFSDLPGFGNSFDNSTGSGSFASPGTSDANYNTLLTSGAFGNTGGSYTVNWSGMTPGNSYLVELWVNDGRNSTVNQRTETITGGVNTSAFLAYGSGSSGPGQYIIGTFVADNSGGETLSLNPGPAIPSAQLNIMQVRDITPVPEPSTLAFLGLGAGAMLFLRRKSSVI
jgi:hypothetical protein